MRPIFFIASAIPLLVAAVLKEPCSRRDNGTLPDAKCTPGAIVLLSKESLCHGTYTETRHVSDSLKSQVFRDYGLNIRKVKGSWEVDHLVPRCLGGADAIWNLWPQQNPEEKDLIEARMCREICSGERDLESTRKAMATDWRSLRQK